MGTLLEMKEFGLGNLVPLWLLLSQIAVINDSECCMLDGVVTCCDQICGWSSENVTMRQYLISGFSERMSERLNNNHIIPLVLVLNQSVTAVASRLQSPHR